MASTTMKDVQIASSSEQKDDFLANILPYALAILVQVPLLVLYYIWLAGRPHYSSWFPFAILATGALIWYRWPNDGKQMFINSLWSNILLVLGLVGGVGGVLFVEPWMAAFSVFTLLTSLMARTIDRETANSNWTVTLPLFVSLAIPLDYDTRLITWLQSTSAHLTSRLLDLVNIAHFMPGTVIKTPTQDYGVEEACSGIQSFFLLIFVAVVISVWLRRTFFRSFLLFISAIVWSIFMNCIRIFLIPVFDVNLQINLSDGVAHDLLGWSTMALGVLLLLSTDQFLMFLFGPVDPGTGSSVPMGKFITKVWNSLIAGGKADEEATKKRRSKRRALSPISKGLCWVCAAILTVGGLWALWDIKNCYAAPESASVNFFTTQVLFPLEASSLPGNVNDWVLVEDSYRSSDRKAASDLGQKSDSWIYRAKKNRYLASASLDQAFPGWHELTKCYTNQGWKRVSRQRKTWEIPETENGEKKFWNYVEAHFEKPTGETAMLVFSLFDGFGEPFDPPQDWNMLQQLWHRSKGRLGERVRARLFQGHAYQTQVFTAGFGPISSTVKDEVTTNYLELREVMRQEFIKSKANSN